MGGVILTAVSAISSAGAYCLLVALGCFMDGDPGRYPVRFPMSILVGLLCLGTVVFLLWRYVQKPSTGWKLLAQVLTAVLLWLPFWLLWMKLGAYIL